MTHVHCMKDFRNREKRSSRSLRSSLNSVSTNIYYFEQNLAHCMFSVQQLYTASKGRVCMSCPSLRGKLRFEESIQRYSCR